MKKPAYPLQPIATVNSLARCLSVPLRDLRSVAENPAHFYRANAPTPKKSDGTRQTFAVEPPLDLIQERILHCILDKVQFPDYLFGVPGTSYVQNAQRHAGQKVLIREDARNFYDSVPASAVQLLWIPDKKCRKSSTNLGSEERKDPEV